jgi:hypothetical protein
MNADSSLAFNLRSSGFIGGQLFFERFFSASCRASLPFDNFGHLEISSARLRSIGERQLISQHRPGNIRP